MTKAVAIAHTDPVKAAIDSAVASAKALNDFMYGTQARARVTTLFGMALIGAAMYLQTAQPAILNYCS